jgi:hypothetical protein
MTSFLKIKVLSPFPSVVPSPPPRPAQDLIKPPDLIKTLFFDRIKVYEGVENTGPVPPPIERIINT